MKDMVFCEDCKDLHEKNAFCLACMACLYRYGTQKGIAQKELEKYPLVRCERCNEVNFWD